MDASRDLSSRGLSSRDHAVFAHGSQNDIFGSQKGLAIPASTVEFGQFWTAHSEDHVDKEPLDLDILRKSLEPVRLDVVDTPWELKWTWSLGARRIISCWFCVLTRHRVVPMCVEHIVPEVQNTQLGQPQICHRFGFVQPVTCQEELLHCLEPSKLGNVINCVEVKIHGVTSWEVLPEPVGQSTDAAGSHLENPNVAMFEVDWHSNEALVASRRIAGEIQLLEVATHVHHGVEQLVLVALDRVLLVA